MKEYRYGPSYCRILKFGVAATAVLLTVCVFSAVAQHAKVLTDSVNDARINVYENELEQYLRHYLVDEYDARTAELWNRDYSSVDAFVRSVAPNRLRWQTKVVKPPVLQKTGSLLRRPYDLLGTAGEWLELPLGKLSARAIIAYPRKAGGGTSVPLVILLHGISNGPEGPFEEGNGYHLNAKALLDAGFAVLAPLNMRTKERRNGIEQLARLADVSLPGIELARLQHLLDVVLEDERIDKSQVGVWGLSLGGMATMFWMPLEPRIKAGIVAGWFNHRLNKMVVPDVRYSSFARNNEDHAFFTGWLTEFSDRDVVSLICPRPLQIQHGKKDGIAHWPQVEEEFARGKVHYERLGLSDRIELSMNEGGHEIHLEEGVRFFKKWLIGYSDKSRSSKPLH